MIQDISILSIFLVDSILPLIHYSLILFQVRRFTFLHLQLFKSVLDLHLFAPHFCGQP